MNYETNKNEIDRIKIFNGASNSGFVGAKYVHGRRQTAEIVTHIKAVNRINSASCPNWDFS